MYIIMLTCTAKYTHGVFFTNPGRHLRQLYYHWCILKASVSKVWFYTCQAVEKVSIPGVSVPVTESAVTFKKICRSNIEKIYSVIYSDTII